MSTKISQLPVATSPVAPDAVLPVVQAGETKKASIDQLGFLQSGTGATTRTIQNKLRDVVSVSDFGANTQTSYDAALAAGNGTVFAPNGYNIRQTNLPDDVVLEYAGPEVPINVYQPDGETTWFAQKVIQGYLPDTPGIALQHIQAVAPGTNVSGPANAGYAQSISVQKKNFPLTTATPGEIDGLTINVRQSGPVAGAGAINDASAILCNVLGLENGGFHNILEAVVTEVNPSTYVATKSVRVQIGVANTRDSESFGFLASADIGVLGEGFRVAGTTSAYFQRAFMVKYNDVVKFLVDGQTGHVTVGGSSIDASAALDVTSTTGGLLFPRMTGTQRDAISSPANGLVLYNTTTNKLQVRAAGAWVDLH